MKKKMLFILLMVSGVYVFSLLFFIYSCNANSPSKPEFKKDFEFGFKKDFLFSIEKDEEAVIHLILKHGDKIKDEYTKSGAPDAMIKSFDFYEWDQSMYVLILFDYGSLGTMKKLEMLDILIFEITDKLNLVNTINLKNILYDGKTRTYNYYKNYSYFHDKNKNSILLFGEIEGKIISVETIMINQTQSIKK